MASQTGLRVALFSGNYNYITDGANKALNRLVGYLEDNGIPVLVFSPTGKEPAFDYRGTVVSVPSISIPGRAEYRLGMGLSKRLKKIISDFNPTLIHLSAPDVLGHSALKYAERNGVPAVASFHTRFDTYLSHYGLGFVEPVLRNQMRKFYNRCEHVYVPSLSMADVLKEAGIVGDNLRRWGRGIERDRFSPEKRDMAWRQSVGIKDEEIAVAFVGRLVKEKGLVPYADTIKLLKKRGLPIRALIVGDGPERAATEALLPDGVFVGHQSGDGLLRAYASADIFLNPSQTETFGNVTLEAMASGVVPVCVSATGTNNLVEDGKTGRLVERPEAPLFADAIESLVQAPGDRTEMAKHARDFTTAFDWNDILAEVVSSYREILGGAPEEADETSADKEAASE